MINIFRKGSANIIVIENPTKEEYEIIEKAEAIKSEIEKKKISFSKFKCNQQPKQITLDEYDAGEFVFAGDMKTPFD